MAEVSQYESDQFLRLLTDALQAGPGSPQWHEAVVQLRGNGRSEADECQLILRAREHLESGRDFRSIRAGDGFTRKVMQAIDEQGGRPAPSANVIALLAAGVILCVIILIGVWLARGPDAPGSVQELASTYFGRTALTLDFSQAAWADWRTFGLAPVVSTRDKFLRGAFSQEDGASYTGGGIVAGSSIPAGESFGVEMTARQLRPASQIALRLFVTDDPSFAANREATSPREFVVELLSGQLSVFKPDGTLAGQLALHKAESGRSTQGSREGEVVHLLVKMDRLNAIVEMDGRQFYAGPHGLSKDQARWPGVRFLTRGSEKAAEDVVVQSLRIIKQ